MALRRFHTLRLWKRTPVALFTIGSLVLSSPVTADPVVDFFKSISRSMGRTDGKPRPRDRGTKADEPASNNSAVKPATPADLRKPVEASASAAAVATPQTIVRAAAASPETHNSSRDIPYGIPVPNKPGFVTSPYAPSQGLVDVRSFRSGTEVKDPYTGKSFLTP